METKYLSATQIAKAQGVPVADVFNALIEVKLIKHVGGIRKWELTEDGTAAGGRYTDSTNFREYIIWPANLDLPIQPLTKTGEQLKAEVPKELKWADTEGEQFIKEFFDDAGIRYEFQKTIRQLSHDEKGHRIADFYLPRYDTYVEFLGLWNANSAFREDYKQKKQVYKQNNISCVFLYPENLGYLHFCFDHRLIETLKQHHKDRELTRYKTWKFLKAFVGNFLGLGLSAGLLFYFDKGGKIIAGVALLYNLYMLIRLWYLIFVKERYNLTRVLYE